jgi:predicted metal-binding membrane protein
MSHEIAVDRADAVNSEELELTVDAVLQLPLAGRDSSRAESVSTPIRLTLLCSFAVIGLAWWQTVSTARQMSGMLDGLARAGGGMPFDAGPIRFAAAWTAMMSAMMLPAIVPLIAAGRTYMRHPLGGVAMAIGYLAVWIPTAVPAFAALTALNQISHPAAWVNRMGGAVIVVAGAYQLTARKRRRMKGYWSRDDFPHATGALRAGLSLGVRCLGSSWALMSTLLVVGVMNLVWMAAISAVCIGDETLTGRETLATGAGLTLIALGSLVIMQPHTLTVVAEI